MLAPGDRLDRYELVWPIAAGGMGQVFIARLDGAHGFKRLFAVKTIVAKLAAEDRFRRMFLDEARILARLDHPNVAQIFDLGEHEGALYLVMEYVDGTSLSELDDAARRADARLPLACVLRIAADTCAGLHAAHELRGSDGARLNVVHRDVSPQNVLVGVQGSVKLIDFGIAHATGRLGGESKVGLVKGKLQYMAPEQARGSGVDARADIWAVGAMIFELVSGRLPYPQTDEIALLRAVVDGAAIEALPDQVPEVVRQVVAKCLRRDPDERYPTAATLRDALLDAATRAGAEATHDDVAALVRDLAPEHVERRERALRSAIAELERRSAGAVRTMVGSPALESTIALAPRTESLARPTPAAPARRSSPRHAVSALAAVGVLVAGGAVVVLAPASATESASTRAAESAVGAALSSASPLASLSAIPADPPPFVLASASASASATGTASVAASPLAVTPRKTIRPRPKPAPRKPDEDAVIDTRK